MRIVAVTSCATGIAHSYMAAESLIKAAKAAGDDIKVEIQGAMGIEDELSREDVESADLVILAVDVAVRRPERFENRNVVEVAPLEAIKDGDAVLEQAKQKGGF